MGVDAETGVGKEIEIGTEMGEGAEMGVESVIEVGTQMGVVSGF